MCNMNQRFDPTFIAGPIGMAFTRRLALENISLDRFKAKLTIISEGKNNPTETHAARELLACQDKWSGNMSKEMFLIAYQFMRAMSQTKNMPQ